MEDTLVLIDSEDRNAAQNANDFSLNNPGYISLTDIKSLAMTNFRVDWVAPNINDYNNRFTFEDEFGGPYVVVLDNGWYDYEGLAAEIESKMRAASGNVNIIVVVNSGATTSPYFVPFTGFRFVVSNPVPGGLLKFSNVRRESTFCYGVKNTTVFAQTVVFDQANLRYTDYIDVEGGQLLQYSRSDESSDLLSNNLLNRIYLAGGGEGATTDIYSFEKEYQTPKWIKFEKSASLGDFQIRLKDQFGNLVYVGQNNDLKFAMTLIAY